MEPISNVLGERRWEIHLEPQHQITTQVRIMSFGESLARHALNATWSEHAPSRNADVHRVAIQVGQFESTSAERHLYRHPLFGEKVIALPEKPSIVLHHAHQHSIACCQTWQCVPLALGHEALVRHNARWDNESHHRLLLNKFLATAALAELVCWQQFPLSPTCSTQHTLLHDHVAELHQLRTLACAQARVAFQENPARHDARAQTRLASFNANDWCLDGAASVCQLQGNGALCHHGLRLHLLALPSRSL
mmetsp:Transcript_5092/g.14170  ORF Transcript_5092/g.14170 Transcript_5092/m.14170 type:complete len:250 (+) Transcript_5092:440-1189(+)